MTTRGKRLLELSLAGKVKKQTVQNDETPNGTKKMSTTSTVTVPGKDRQQRFVHPSVTLRPVEESLKSALPQRMAKASALHTLKKQYNVKDDQTEWDAFDYASDKDDDFTVTTSESDSDSDTYDHDADTQFKVYKTKSSADTYSSFHQSKQQTCTSVTANQTSNDNTNVTSNQTSKDNSSVTPNQKSKDNLSVTANQKSKDNSSVTTNQASKDNTSDSITAYQIQTSRNKPTGCISESQGQTSTESDMHDFMIQETSTESREPYKCQECNRTFKKKGGFTVHMKSHLKGNEQYRKPKRMCTYCKKEFANLTRHIKSMHHKEDEVAAALLLPQDEMMKKFSEFRKVGIWQVNKEQAALDNPVFARQKKGQTNNLVMCNKCRGFYARAFFYKHKDICIEESSHVPTSVSANVISIESQEQNKEFVESILSSFRDDEAGKLCKTDVWIRIIGLKLWSKSRSKVDKAMEVRKSVMTDMRRLAVLFDCFKQYSAKGDSLQDMYVRDNFNALETAIEEVTRKDSETIKYGLKSAYYYLLLNSATIIKSTLFVKKNDLLASEIEKFLDVLKLNKEYIFGDATYAINYSRQAKLRAPEETADEIDVVKLRDHTIDTISKLTDEYVAPFTIHEFVELRDAICSRITLFNARRGGEPSRLRLSNYEAAKKKSWLDPTRTEKLPAWERQLFKDMDITYMTGKGNHLVPVLIPTDCKRGLEILSDTEIRQQCSVNVLNTYLFPNTGQSLHHVSGWQTTNKMCHNSGVSAPDLMNATHQRHRLSTKYAELDVPEYERELFYKHMGHQKAVNLGTYQNPLPILEMTKIGKHLRAFDNANTNVTDTEKTTELTGEEIATQSHPVDDMHNPTGVTVEGIDTQSLPVNDMHDPISTSSTNIDTVPDRVNVVTAIKDIKKSSNHRWSKTDTDLVCDVFKEWIMLPKGSMLPGKKELEVFLQSQKNKISSSITYLKLRTKIMNEQKRHQNLGKSRWANFQEPKQKKR